MNMYLYGSAKVRWDSTTSHSFNVINCVKQGSVISPLFFTLFFTLYVDELIDKLEHRQEYIISEYKLDYALLQLSHVFNIKANMDIMYKESISAHIHVDEWKIIMISDIVDCLN